MKKGTSFRLFVLGVALGSASCEEDGLTKMCRVICQDLACGGGNVTPCKNDCIERMDAAEAHSIKCAEVYGSLLDCLDSIGCVNILDWEELRGKDFEYDCREQTESFLDVCPELWFKGE